jgi:pSer/pThr/pTyr-binding forkhead associated (FHA) protein
MPRDIAWWLNLWVLGLVYILLGILLRTINAETRRLVRQAGAGSARLIVIEPAESGLLPGEALPLRPETTVGRDRSNDVCLPDPSVSHRHARLYFRNRNWWVEDLNSTNGTSVNGRRIEGPGVVMPGDRLAFGNVVTRLEARS